MSAEKSVDRLNELPDDILCYILSFLEMKEAAITCLLSKRWQFLWTELPALRFELCYEETSEFVIRVNRTLALCSRHNLERFEVDFGMGEHEECFASDVNVWIGFAVKNKVKQFILRLPYRTGRYHMLSEGYHMLPQMMYLNPSWTSLTLERCVMAPRGTIQWQSLTTLCMYFVELNEHTFQNILSGCPVLSSLDLVFCREFNRLEVNSPSLLRLAIKDCESGDDLQISAPYLHTFKINVLSESRKLCLENIKSLVRAEIDVHVIYGGSIEQLLGSIGHVRMLELGRGCIELLSLIAPDRQHPQSKRECLELHAYCGNKSVPGILGLLETSPNLETLVIHVDKLFYQDDVWENPASKYDLNSDLNHLKTVDFKIIGNPDLHTEEPMLTLARIFLKRAIALEKMVVNFHRFTALSSTTSCCKMTQKLLSYSKTSQKAVVLFC